MAERAPRERLHALGAALLLAALLFAPALFGGKLFVPLHTLPLLPWRSDAPADEVAALREAGNPELSDKLWLFHPDNAEVAASWRRGELPTWNRTIVGGVPLLGQALYGALYPPNALLLWITPLERAYAWSAALHVVLAVLGARWLARRLGLAPAPALLAGVLFAASGPLLVRYHYYMTFFAAVWVPWLLAAVHAYAKGASVARWLAIPLPIALIVLSGFPQTGLYGVVGAALLGASVLLREQRGAALRPLLALVAAFALGLALSAPQVTPVDATTKGALQRPHDVEQQLREAGTPPLLLGYALPGAFMDSREPWSQSFGKNPLWNALYARVERQPDGSGLPIGSAARPSTTEASCYAGALAIGLLLAAFATGSRRALALPLLLALSLAAALGYALGVPLLVRGLGLLPRFDIGEVRRILPTAALLVALLAALGLERFLEPERRAARRIAFGATLLIALLLAALAVALERLGPGGLAQWFHQRQVALYGAELVAKEAAMAARTPAEDAALFDFVRGSAWRAAAWFGGAAVLLALAAALVGRGRRRVALLLLAGFAVADLAAFHFRVNPFLPAERFAAPVPLLEPLAAATSGGRVRRFAPDWRFGDDSIEKLPLPPNLGALFGIEDGEGYLVQLPVRYARWQRALEPEAGGDFSVLTVAALPLRTLAALRSPLLTGSSVRHLLSRHDVVAALAAEGGDTAGWTPIAQQGELRLFANDRALPFAWVVPSARFLPPPPPDDAIGTPRDDAIGAAAAALAPPGELAAEARASWHAALLADLAADPLARRDHAWLEAELPAAFAGERATAMLPLADGSALPIAVATVRGAPSQVVAIERQAARVAVTLDGGGGGFLVVNEGFAPGWEATIDGLPATVVPADVAWRAVALPPGAREVVLTYRPESVARGLRIGAVAAAAWLLVALLAAKRRLTRGRAPPAAPPDAERARAG
ncbi:MAG: hypothetical protein JNL90_08385 [Planctomycetes bacterium]|nr:hypothetical protein [Planctomycetota bacterium]